MKGAEKNAAGSSSPLGPKTDKVEKKKVERGRSDHVIESSERKSTTPEGRSKILIRFRAKSLKPDEEVAGAGNQNLNAEEADDLVAKTWNLRPRRPILKPPIPGGGGVKLGRPPVASETKSQRSELTRPRNQTEGKAAEKKVKKPKFSITLTREEIEEDIFAMTGARASRRPKKRPKNVQKQIDNVFPGMWLDSITPDLYRVPDPSAKVAGLD